MLALDSWKKIEKTEVGQRFLKATAFVDVFRHV